MIRKTCCHRGCTALRKPGQGSRYCATHSELHRRRRLHKALDTKHDPKSSKVVTFDGQDFNPHRLAIRLLHTRYGG